MGIILGLIALLATSTGVSINISLNSFLEKRHKLRFHLGSLLVFLCAILNLSTYFYFISYYYEFFEKQTYTGFSGKQIYGSALLSIATSILFFISARFFIYFFLRILNINNTKLKIKHISLGHILQFLIIIACLVMISVSVSVIVEKSPESLATRPLPAYLVTLVIFSVPFVLFPLWLLRRSYRRLRFLCDSSVKTIDYSHKPPSTP